MISKFINYWKCEWEIYGGDNIRYKHTLKAQYIRDWTKLHDDIIPWNKIRYIF